MVATLRVLEAEVAKLDKEIAARAKSDADARRLMTIPGVGPITATALLSIALLAAAFENGRHFAAWLGLAPRQHSSGGKDNLGRITKAGDKTLRRLLIIGASAVLRHAAIKPPPAGSWLARMMAGKPRMLVAVALANKMARIIWALLRNGASYQASSAAA
jgi:transposase